MKEFWRLFFVFLRKNILFVRFNWKILTSIFIGCYIILIVYLNTTNGTQVNPELFYDLKDLEVLKTDFPGNENDYIFFTPANPDVIALMEKVREDLERPTNTFRPFADANEMQLELEQNCKGNCFAINFKNYPTEGSGSNDELQYSISSTEVRASPNKLYVNDEELNVGKEEDDYTRTGFVTLEYLIDKHFIQSFTKSGAYNVQIAPVPIQTMNSTSTDRLMWFGSIYSVIFNVLLLSTFLVPLVEEKQNGLKEFLVMATPFNFLNGLTFFLVRLVLYLLFLVAVLVTTAIFFIPLGTVSMGYIFLLFLLFMVSAMCYTYLISVCFHSVFYAKVGGLLLLIIPYILYFSKGFISSIANIFATKTFLDGLNIFQVFTYKYRSLTIGDLSINITESSWAISSIFFLLILQCLFYALLYSYLSYIFPGPGGLKKSYLFPFQMLWSKQKQRNEYTTSERGTNTIIIEDLCKEFKSPPRLIARNLKMEIKNKQITVLLGHNGVGKTTTLNMIMGIEPKDSGKIMVCSERDVASYRHLIGFCPQHSVFMHYMTCQQHLEFFAELRGKPRSEARNLAENLLEQLRLQEKRDEYGKNLSGGMKRRLSLGIAVAGDTKVIVLDEPSSGLDIESRRELWDILLELRKRKAVLVTTHHMEEAEVLGDTICIMAEGQIQHQGTPLELKRKVGKGYILKLCVDEKVYQEDEILELIREKGGIEEAQILNVIPPTVLISLPYDSKSYYHGMLEVLEGKSTDLGIKSISISDTSLEDVFLNCAPQYDEVDGGYSGRELRNPSSHISWMQQFKAIAYKKRLFLCNEWVYTTVMTIIPILAILLAIMLMKPPSGENVENVLPLNLGFVHKGIIYIKSPESETDSSRKLLQLLTEEIQRHHIKAVPLYLTGNHTTMKQELIGMQSDQFANFLQNTVGAIELHDSGNEYTVRFAANLYHSSVVMLNLLDNALLRLKTNEKVGISTSYAPIRRYISDISPTRLEYYAVIVPIGMFFYIFYYVTLPFKENENGFKILQAVPCHIYWMSVFVLDVLQHLLVCLCIYAVQAIFMPNQFYTAQEQQLIVISLFFYGCSYLPILYAFGNCFNSISTVSTYLLFMFITSAIIPLITSGSVQAMNFHETAILFLSFLPDFNLNHQLRIINERFMAKSRNQLLASSYSGFPAALSTNTFFVYAIIVCAAVMLVFVFILENKDRRQAINDMFICYKCRGVTPKTPVGFDEEEGLVDEEKKKVDEIVKEKSEANYRLLVTNLQKSYGRVAAVRGLNFVVPRSECFGLLGVNGAGKTSTFQMITGNTTISGGTVKIDGIDIRENEVLYKYHFGYCPQSDCLNQFMTASQTLLYIAKLRGIETARQESEVNFWLDKLGIQKYKDTLISRYSGGTKRKLNAGVAMIGDPALVLLDEPTTGVDPSSRRFLWQCIKDFQKEEKTVVLTSHSLDECEQLCNRLAIMAYGKLKCIGSIPDLKQRFGSGFTIKVKMKDEDNEESEIKLINRLREYFPEVYLRESHAGMLTYFIKNTDDLQWSAIFKATEEIFYKHSDTVEEYSVNETTLEDIFLKFDVNIEKPAVQVHEINEQE